MKVFSFFFVFFFNYFRVDKLQNTNQSINFNYFIKQLLKGFINERQNLRKVNKSCKNSL